MGAAPRRDWPDDAAVPAEDRGGAPLLQVGFSLLRRAQLGGALEQSLLTFLEYLGSVNREQTIKMSGEDKALLVKALSDALAKPIWGTLTIKTNSLLARKTISGFRPYAHIPEVASMLAHLRSSSKVKANSLELHYLRRRYLDGVSLRDSAELNNYFEQCLRDPQALVYEQRSKDQVRYAVYSAQTGWVAFVEADGRRISVHPLQDDPNQLGRLLWRIQDLLP